MSIKTVLDSLDGVDETLKPLYVEHDGKFHLDLDESVRDHRDVVALRNAHERNKTDLATARTEAKKAKDDLAAALKDKPDEATIISERQRIEKERDDALKDRDEARSQLTGVTRDTALTAALAASGVTDPGLQSGATALLRDRIKMVDGKPIVETDMGPKALADHVKHWAASEGKSFVTPPQGGGAKGSESQNGGKTTGNMGGSPQERAAAIQAKIDAGT